MPRAIVLIILLLAVIAGLLFFLSRQAEEVPTRTIEVDVSSPANAS
jgi:lipopolysaccharide export system protein LptC